MNPPSGGDFWSAVAVTWSIVVVVVDWTIRVLALIYVPRNRRPQTALAWLLLIMFAPVPGIVLLGLFGSRRLPRRRRRKQREINEFILDASRGVEVEPVTPWPDWLPPIVELNRTLGAMPMIGGNVTNVVTDYERSIEEMTDAVRAARRFVHAEFYILAWDTTTAPFFAALADAVARGVTVRVLLDHIATVRSAHWRRTIRKLSETGAQWEFMLPVQPWRGRFQRIDLRNHRKLLVIDNTIGFTGSQNMIDASYNKRGNIRRHLQWKDLMVRFEGPIAAGINALFITDWYSETDELLAPDDEQVVTAPAAATLDCQVVPSGPGFEGENNLRLFNALVYAAKERVILVSPYFVPDDSMLYAITTAAQSGLEVQLFVSEIGDQPVVYHAQRSYYEQLLRAGVRIFLYRAPTLLHAKHFTIDDQVAVIGSSNMDMRSFSLNLEISVMVHGTAFVKRLREVEADYRAASTELTLEDWLKQPRPARTLDSLARLTATVQ
ncbi:cardiolipin synthase [Galbitalea sp. SE-J8]|uniref:cardiolipin synthase n=1 Tax=Galbitalea sp. SE-J8 TaxID=3054952 RepID=UPI00259CA429|nr:cardiolipin synthase [Galbitalea sp. SE-J8]MDM4762413.1 cardiolipin synthase [Galbitalea sp. SE-J8]